MLKSTKRDFTRSPVFVIIIGIANRNDFYMNGVFMFDLQKESFCIDISYKKELDYDIIIVAGQSNAEGYGKSDFGYTYKPHKPIYGYNGKNRVTLACDKRYGIGNKAASFALYFADEYVRSGCLAAGRSLLLLNTAVGGTGFSDHRWGKGEDLSERLYFLTNKLMKKNPKNNPVAVLWHQGETDVMSEMKPQVYSDNLKVIIETIRRITKKPNLPFISGNMVPSWMAENPFSYQIADATRMLMKTMPCCAYVETDGLNGNPGQDHIHFSRKSCVELGRRYFEKYCGIVRTNSNMPFHEQGSKIEL